MKNSSSLQSQSNCIGFSEGPGLERPLTLCGLYHKIKPHKWDHCEERITKFFVCIFYYSHSSQKHCKGDIYLFFLKYRMLFLGPHIYISYLNFSCAFFFEHRSVCFFPSLHISLQCTLKCFPLCLSGIQPSQSLLSFIHENADPQQGREQRQQT